jgi:hypothetical protein
MTVVASTNAAAERPLSLPDVVGRAEPVRCKYSCTASRCKEAQEGSTTWAPVHTQGLFVSCSVVTVLCSPFCYCMYVSFFAVPHVMQVPQPLVQAFIHHTRYCWYCQLAGLSSQLVVLHRRGPAILDLSAYAVMAMTRGGPRPSLTVNWTGEAPEVWDTRLQVRRGRSTHGLASVAPHGVLIRSICTLACIAACISDQQDIGCMGIGFLCYSHRWTWLTALGCRLAAPPW